MQQSRPVFLSQGDCGVFNSRVGNFDRRCRRIRRNVAHDRREMSLAILGCKSRTFWRISTCERRRGGMARILNKSKRYGLPGLLGSIDYSHLTLNKLKRVARQIGENLKMQTVTLEAIAE